MEEKQQYDSLLGGKQELPASINLMSFALARGKEIVEMRQALNSNKATKLAFQTLPKHMRRRCMSHNSKRLPRRLREIHMRQMMKSGLPPKQKRPSRKHRRRMSNLLDRKQSEDRNDKRKRWLETHIWHAKRFHMVERWGYRVPERPCDKSFRACYRATTNHCLLQDISYYNCIELEGIKQMLINNLNSLTDSTTGLTFAARAYINGNREGNLMLFNKGKKPIGRVYFHWKLPDQTSNGVIWLWIHAAYYEESLEELKLCFGVTKSSSCLYYNNSDGVCMRELRNELNRLRLTGPLSNAILHEALKLSDLCIKSESTSWFVDYLKSENNLNRLQEQRDYWLKTKNSSNCSELSPHMVISLIVSDPRYRLPRKRTKVASNACPETHESALSHPVNICHGPIWDHNIRAMVKETKQSNECINNLRSKLLVPGTDLNETGSPVPILLIQRPGDDDNGSGFCSGWDVILPGGWAQPFWLSLIMYGAKPGGIRETNSIDYESSGRTTRTTNAAFPPDTKAGETESRRIESQIKSTYFRRPPNKRINYNKLAVVCPFRVDWNRLVAEWGGDGTCASVLRDVKRLNDLKESLRAKRNKSTDLHIDSYNYIVPIKVTMLSDGRPNFNALICLPNAGEDLSELPIEPRKADASEELRNELRVAHRTLLKRLRRKRKAKKDENDIETSNRKTHLQVIREFNERMQQLWLPRETASIKDSCSHEIIGYVTNGGFSFAKGKGYGTGYVTIGGLAKLMSLNRRQLNKVLVRNTNSRRYRLATIEI